LANRSNYYPRTLRLQSWEVQENDLSGKTIILFSTHEGSGLAGTEKAIRDYTKGKVVDNVLSIRGKRVQDSKAETDVKNWIKKLRDNKNI